MLEKIVRLENIGLFAAGTPKAVDFKRATLIYADNARGKSTLSAVLKACATSDPAPMTARATIGATAPTRVQMRFKLPTTGGANVNYENGKWDVAAPHVVVFDQAFVEQNVYAGSEVLTDHHQALLDFAIGVAAVAKKKDIDTNAEAQVAATRLRSAAEGRLQGYRSAMALPVFLALAEDKEAEAKIADLTKRIANTKAQAALTQRAALNRLALPTVDFRAFEAVLPGSFKQVQANAAELVREHVNKHGGKTERWVATGHQFPHRETCPFCGQQTEGLPLIEAYDTYFNNEYNAHMQRVSELAELANRSFTDAMVGAWGAEFRANADRAQAWADQLKLELATPGLEEMLIKVASIRACLTKAADDKARAPLDPLDVSVIAEAVRERDAVLRILDQYNQAVDAVNSTISQFKRSLQGESQATLEASVARLQAQKVRHSAEVVAIVEDRTKQDKERDKFEAAKNKARNELDMLMSSLLSQYQSDINKWLVHLHASFKVDKLNFTYQGGTSPRTEYGIVLRNKLVTAGRKAANALSFQTALSDGDKRTLALAFFLARVLDEKSCGTSVVVLDDVFASFDKDRRSQTISALCDMATKCAQVIVLAHDAYFLRDLQRKLVDKHVAEIVPLQIRRIGEFSELTSCDYTELCASPYYKRYREITDYLTGAAPSDLLPVAIGLRPFVEGNMHRRFPGDIKEGVTFGAILDQIKNAPAGHALAQLQPQVPALQQFNDFVGAFHHDTVGVAPRQEVTDGELKPFAQRALGFVHLGTMA